jgi:hypothetical protein
MSRITVSKNFKLDEFIHPDIYNIYKSQSIKFIDVRLITIAQEIREDLGLPLTINTWYNGGGFKNSGLRKFDSTTGAKMSQHKFGRAIDLKCSKCDALKIAEVILNNKEKYLKLGVGRLENPAITKTWLHVDLASYHNNGDIVVFNP